MSGESSDTTSDGWSVDGEGFRVDGRGNRIDALPKDEMGFCRRRAQPKPPPRMPPKGVIGPPDWSTDTGAAPNIDLWPFEVGYQEDPLREAADNEEPNPNAPDNDWTPTDCQMPDCAERQFPGGLKKSFKLRAYKALEYEDRKMRKEMGRASVICANCLRDTPKPIPVLNDNMFKARLTQGTLKSRDGCYHWDPDCRMLTTDGVKSMTSSFAPCSVCTIKASPMLTEMTKDAGQKEYGRKKSK